MSDSALEARVRLKVAFYDLDPMNIVWHGNYFKYFERARQALFDAAGLDLYKPDAMSGCVFPIIRSQVKHIRPLRHRDEFDCIARVTDANIKLVVDFEIRLLNSGELCTKARSEQVAVRVSDGALELSLPDSVKHALSRRVPCTPS